ncbi:hypothetical protein [Streptomyces sp. NPDC050848]|uniref:hypothetical protein n=1 Tax=Streptomyces sp. NPDC050848 TaxID=3155791 RepID=UPI0033C80371
MVVAAAIALIGVLCGLFIGRRTVRDQAQVEHSQWLRGQRQEAYVQLLAAWDDLLPRLEQMVLSDDDIAGIDQHDAWEAAGCSARDGVDLYRAPLRRAVERVEMLGPEEVEHAASALGETGRILGNCIVAQYGIVLEEGVGRRPLELFDQSIERVDNQRAAFVAATKDQLRQTPDVKRPRRTAPPAQLESGARRR